MSDGNSLYQQGAIVRTLRGVGHRGNWKAEGAKLWRIHRWYPSYKYRSGVCIELWPYDTSKRRLHPLKMDAGLVELFPKLRVALT